MIKIVTILLIFILLNILSHSQPTDNKIDKNNFKQGKWLMKRADNSIKAIGTFIDNFPVDTFRFYNKSGTLSAITYYKDTVQVYTSFLYPNGKIQAVGKYENKKKDSLWKYFSKEGILLSTEFYLSGKKEGNQKMFYNQNKICEIKHFSRGFESGKWLQYFKNGRLKLSANYENGYLQGKALYFDSNGDTVAQGFFFRDTRHGKWLFYKNNKIANTEWYEKGKLIKTTKKEQIFDLKSKGKRKNRLELEDVMPKKNQQIFEGEY